MEYRWRSVTRGVAVLLLLVAVFSLISCGKHSSNPPDNHNIVWKEVPWTDGETTKYQVQDSQGNAIGEATFTIYKEGNAWVFRADYDLIVNQQPVTQQITTKVSGEDLKPISGSIIGSAQANELYTEYRDSGLTITIKSPQGEEQTRTFDIGGVHDIYDNDEAIFLVRSLPLQQGYGFSYTNVTPITVAEAATAVSWRVDTTGPVATLSGQPTGIVNYNTADITVGGDGVVAYKYNLDGGAWGDETPVAIHITLSDLSDAEHTVDVIGKDASGTWRGIASATWTRWTVYTAGPIATLSGQPNGAVDYKTADITVGGDGVIAYKYKIDSSDWSEERATDTHITLLGLSDGTHTVSVIGKDSSANWQAEESASTASWTVVTLEPVALLSGQPAGTVGYNTADITVGGFGVVAYKYQVDGGDWSDEIAASNHIILSGLSDGTHAVSVLGKDAAGNWQWGPLGMATMAVKVMPTLDHLQTPDGYVWAYKVSLIDQSTTQGVYLWYDVDAPHQLLYYDDGNKRMSLVEHN